MFAVLRIKAASAPVNIETVKNTRVLSLSKRERLLLWELCGGNPEETAEKELSITYIARKNQSAASPKKYIRLSAWSFYTSIYSLLLVNLSGAIHIAYGIFFSYEHYACRFVCGKVALLSS